MDSHVERNKGRSETSRDKAIGRLEEGNVVKITRIWLAILTTPLSRSNTPVLFVMVVQGCSKL